MTKMYRRDEISRRTDMPMNLPSEDIVAVWRGCWEQETPKNRRKGERRCPRAGLRPSRLTAMLEMADVGDEERRGRENFGRKEKTSSLLLQQSNGASPN